MCSWDCRLFPPAVEMCTKSVSGQWDFIVLVVEYYIAFKNENCKKDQKALTFLQLLGLITLYLVL